MRPLWVKNYNSSVLATLLILSLVTPSFVSACECVCACLQGAAGEKVQDITEVTPETCCSADGRGMEVPVDKCFDATLTEPSCDSQPFCCCADDFDNTPAVNTALLKDDARTHIAGFEYLEAGLSVSLPDLHHINSRSCFAFQKNMTPTPPHIASTILLI